MVTRAGLSLIEVVVALALLSMTVLGVAAGGLLAARILRDAALEEEFSTAASALLDSLVTDSITGSGSMPHAGYRLDWTASAESAAVRVLTHDSANFTLRAVR